MRRRLGYVPALDGLRGVAILLVLAAHLGGWWAGARGVDLFFVLSGFLITTLLLEERAAHGRVSLRGFYMRRARRLFPALAVLLASYLVIEAVRGYDALGQVARYGLYLGNWFAAYGPARTGGDPLTRDGLGHLWSLAQEEQYYLVWPLILFAIAKARRPVGWAVTLALAGLAVRVGLAWTSSVHSLGTEGYYLPTLHSQGLLIGSAAAVWRSQRGVTVTARAAVNWVALGAFMLAITSGGGRAFFVWKLTVFELAAVMVVLAAVECGEFARVASWRPLVWVGKISYSLYLWHFVWVCLFSRSDWLTVLALSFMSAAASHYLVERPIRRRPARVPSLSLKGPVGEDPVLQTS